MTIDIDAMDAGREMDVLIAETVIGLTVSPITTIGFGGVRPDVGTVGQSYEMPDGRQGVEATKLPEYSTEPGPMMVVIKELIEKFSDCMEHLDDSDSTWEFDLYWSKGLWHVEMLTGRPLGGINTHGDTPMLAVCRAAYKAMKGEY